MTANASPAVLAPVDVDAILAAIDKAAADLHSEFACSSNPDPAADLDEARAAVERLAADLAAAREERDEWFTKCDKALADLYTLRQRAEAAEAGLVWVSREWSESRSNEYVAHVLRRGGTGDLSDMLAFVQAAALQEPRNG